MDDPSEASRPILWNVDSGLDVTLFYLAFALSAVVFSAALYARFALWRAGTPDDSRFNLWAERLRYFYRHAIAQRGVRREKLPGVFHLLIFWGFMALFFTTSMVFVHQDLGLPVFKGWFYLFLTVLSDVLGFGLLIGVIIAAYRRYRLRPDFLHQNRAAPLVLVLLALMVIQGFVIEGLRIAAAGDPWRFFSPFGYLTSLAFNGFHPETLRAAHWTAWWFHSLTVFVFIAILPYTKFLHIFSSSANLYFKDLVRPKGAMPFPGDVEQIMEQAIESGSDEIRLGASTVSDLTWKQRLDLDACTECGRCQSVCPAYNSAKPLSPKWLILDTRDHLLGVEARGLTRDPARPENPLLRLNRRLLGALMLPLEREPERRKAGNTFRGANVAVQNAALEVGLSAEAKIGSEVQDANVFWSCTTCRACMEVCPVGIEHLDLIGQVRRSLTMIDGELPAEAQASLRAIETRGNPFGPEAVRADWTKGLEVPVLEAGASVDVLYWVGCVSAYDRRKQSIARSMVQILNASGLRWGIFGNKESCTGDPARRLGDENLFQTQAKKNIELINSISCNTIVANCPHCFNTLKNEYRQIAPFLEGRSVRILHHTEWIGELIDGEKLKLKKTLNAPVTYHDPCYLGRHNDIYDEPRRILRVLSDQPQAVTEMSDYREHGMCCGAGGGHFWMDIKLGKRINVLRAEQAAKTGADQVATGCPFCLHMLEDGVKLAGEGPSIVDIAELVAAAL